MGWNDSRVSLLAPGWRLLSEEAPNGARAIDDTPLMISHLERRAELGSTDIRPDAVEAWLERRGFDLRQKREDLIRLQWEDVEAFLTVKEKELAEINLTFTLSRNSPSRWASWQDLVMQLCETWDLMLYVPDLDFNVDANELLSVLARTHAWRDFEVNYKWPSVTSGGTETRTQLD